MWRGDRRSELPADWPRRRLAVLERDGFRCQWSLGHDGKCGAPANQVDHVRRGNDHSLVNLRALCEEHHREKSSFEGWDEYRARLTESRAKFQGRQGNHPGVL